MEEEDDDIYGPSETQGVLAPPRASHAAPDVKEEPELSEDGEEEGEEFEDGSDSVRLTLVQLRSHFLTP